LWRKEGKKKKEEYNEGKIEGKWKRKVSGKKGKYLGGIRRREIFRRDMLDLG
jgi:hypothetical protein